ncbi:signal peptidase I [Staphylococcus lutrae]|uniref:signal peptidase I n=1 Tax=Staphylococcus lutrae TaxID=155085 RepID=UPI00146D203C|nr:signal peptidase I [Staphylococcus lutrae]
MKYLIKSMIAAISAIILLMILVIWVVIPYEVKEANMTPTLHPHDRLIVNKISPRYGLHHEDIVVYQVDHQYRVGRVIGEPGQSVEFQNGQLQLDHTPVAEPYLLKHDSATWSLKSLPGSESDIIPPNRYLVLNDQRRDRQDSRQFGLIEKSNIEGTIAIRYFPFDSIKTYF